MKRFLVRLLAIAMIPALAAGCTRSSPRGTMFCPDARIIHGLDRIETAQGERTVGIGGLDGACRLSGTVLELDYGFEIEASGPAGSTIPYFVVTLDPDGQVLDKTSFVVRVPDDAGPGPFRLLERLEQRIEGVAAGTSSRYTLLIGLDLPPETALRQRRDL